MKTPNLVPIRSSFCCLLILAGLLTLPGNAAGLQGKPVVAAYLPLLLKPGSPPSPSQIIYSDPVTYQVEKSVWVENTSFDLGLLEVYQPLATNWDSQTVVIEILSPTPTSLDYDPVHGNGILYWGSTESPQPGQTVQFLEQFTVTVQAISAQIDADSLPTYDTSSALYQLYTRPEDALEADHPVVIQAAQDAVGDETNPYRQAELIYDYVAAHLSYMTNDGADGALETLLLGTGECGDYAAVFSALCRVVGIPARPVVGYMASSGASHHVWAEFYLQDVGWVPVDATFGDEGQHANDWYFGNLDNQRIIMAKNYNITLVPSDTTVVLLQAYYWWIWGSGGEIRSWETWEVERVGG